MFIIPAFSNPIGEFALGSFIYGVAAILYGGYIWYSNPNKVEDENLKKNVDPKDLDLL